MYPDVLTACRRTVKWRDEVTCPIAENVARYDQAYRIFCQLYPALKSVGENNKE
jgi:sugar (pentulose or hexulose) kinase